MPILLTPYIDADVQCTSFMGMNQHAIISGVAMYDRFLLLRSETRSQKATIPTKRQEVWYETEDWRIFAKFKQILPDGVRHEHSSWRSQFVPAQRLNAQSVMNEPRLWLIEAQHDREVATIRRSQSLAALAAAAPEAPPATPTHDPPDALASSSSPQPQIVQHSRIPAAGPLAAHSTTHPLSDAALKQQQRSLDHLIQLASTEAADSPVCSLPHDCMTLISQWVDTRISCAIWDIRGDPTPGEVQRATMLCVCRAWFELVTTAVQKWLGAPVSYWVAHLPQLRWIDASHTDAFDWPMLPIAIGTDWLQKLSLARCSVNGSEVSQLRCIDKLLLLDLSHTLLDSRGMCRIAAQARSLQHLTIDGCTHMTAAGFSSISQLTQLSALSIGANQWLTDSLVAQVLLELPKLLWLSLSKCSQLSTACLTTISLLSLNHLSLCGMRRWKCPLSTVLQATSKCTSIDLTGCVALCSTGPFVASACPALTSLNLNGCTKLSSEIYSHVTATGAQLHSLHLNSCFRVGLSQLLLPPFDHLRCVHLSSLAAVDDHFVESLVYSNRVLQQLNLSKCSHLSDCTLRVLGHCLTLEWVDLTGCTKMSQQALRDLRLTRRALEVVDRVVQARW